GRYSKENKVESSISLHISPLDFKYFPFGIRKATRPRRETAALPTKGIFGPRPKP
ncbi:unnamed protein product, partial [Schistosoma mattheei]